MIWSRPLQLQTVLERHIGFPAKIHVRLKVVL